MKKFLSQINNLCSKTIVIYLLVTFSIILCFIATVDGFCKSVDRNFFGMNHSWVLKSVEASTSKNLNSTIENIAKKNDVNIFVTEKPKDTNIIDFFANISSRQHKIWTFIGDEYKYNGKKNEDGKELSSLLISYTRNSISIIDGSEAEEKNLRDGVYYLNSTQNKFDQVQKSFTNNSISIISNTYIGFENDLLVAICKSMLFICFLIIMFLSCLYIVATSIFSNRTRIIAPTIKIMLFSVLLFFLISVIFAVVNYPLFFGWQFIPFFKFFVIFCTPIFITPIISMIIGLVRKRAR